MYNSVICHLYIILCVYHPKSSLLPPPFIPPFTLFYLPPHPFPLIITILFSGSVNFLFYFLLRFILSPFSPSPSNLPLLTAVNLFSVSMSLFLFCLLVYFVHLIPHMSEIIWHLSFSDWLISLSIMFSRPIHTATKGKKILFLTMTTI